MDNFYNLFIGSNCYFCHSGSIPDVIKIIHDMSDLINDNLEVSLENYYLCHLKERIWIFVPGLGEPLMEGIGVLGELFT